MKLIFGSYALFKRQNQTQTNCFSQQRHRALFDHFPAQVASRVETLDFADSPSRTKDQGRAISDFAIRYGTMREFRGQKQRRGSRLPRLRIPSIIEPGTKGQL